MTPAQKAEYRENFAAEMAIIVARKELTYDGVTSADLDAATIAALWRALEIASKGMSKEALKRMVFGENADVVREALKQIAEKLRPIAHNSTDDPRGAAYEALALIDALEVGK